VGQWRVNGIEVVAVTGHHRDDVARRI